MKSPKQLLLEQIYPGDLSAEVARRVDAGESWRAIAAYINTRVPDGIHVKVSYESLRTWYGQPEQVAS